MLLKIIVFVFTAILVLEVEGECPEGCDHLMVNFYESVACKPLYDQPTDCCPKGYDCGFLFDTPPGHCHYQGQRYRQSDVVQNSFTEFACDIGCECESLEGTDGSYGFRCAAIDCPENFDEGLSEGCYYKHDLYECCFSGTACPPFDTVAKCVVSGKTYLQGQPFWPEKCTSCVCRKGYEGRHEEPHCIRRKCSDEIHYSLEIDRFYAPYFREDNDCCPGGWLAPNNGSDAAAISDEADRSGSRCRFGSAYYEIGATVTRVDRKNFFTEDEFRCKCEMPPFMTCATRSIYDVDKVPQHLRKDLGL